MSIAFDHTENSAGDLFVLRQLIARLAPQCGVDLSMPATVRHFLDSDPTTCSERYDPKLCRDLQSMLTLLYRLESSSSEDLGLSGLHRLWHQHSELLARHA